ncbi:Hypothetical protein PHPALM_17792 [Phytophthora palmivora]|uniref:Uncharacterized protein n=1 Tax=Phytophthora palmivora TaxID=4796 RepID=A0A2P4XLB9_9STRA|nr:Hypothetical protein PHPALM_17792 [Phytophthora palmivora]
MYVIFDSAGGSVTLQSGLNATRTLSDSGSVSVSSAAMGSSSATGIVNVRMGSTASGSLLVVSGDISSAVTGGVVVASSESMQAMH